MTDMLRILLADASTACLCAARELLDAQDGMTVIGTTESGADALRISRELVPDVVLMEIQLNDGDGIAAGQAIKALLPETRVIIVAMQKGIEYRHWVTAHGLDGFIYKPDLNDELPRLLRELRES